MDPSNVNEPGKVDDPSQTETGRHTVNYPIDSMIYPDPIRRVIRAVDRDNQHIPGEIVISPQGKLLKKYLEYQRFEGDIVESYNNWIVHQLQRQVAARPLRLPDGYFMAVLKISFNKPKLSTSANENVPLYPKIARDRGYSYVANMYGNLGLFKTVGNKAQLIEQANNVFLGKIPVMLGSVLCHLSGKTEQERLAMQECPKDPLGYFIIKGTERIIMIQEKLRVNRIFMFGDKKGQPICRMTCSTIKGTRVVTLSQSETRGIQISLHFIGKGHTLSVFQIYRILGITDIDDMLSMVLTFVKDKHKKKIWWILQPSFLELMSVAGNDDLEDIRNKRGSRVLTQALLLQYLTDDLFPQMARLPTINRIYMLSMMVARYAEFMAGISLLDDRDSWANKRLETAGRSMEQLFNGLWNKMIEQAETQFEKQKIKDVKLNYVVKLLTTTIISDEFVSSFSANNWGVKGSFFSKENITDVLKRDAPLSVFSHLTRINTPTSRQARQPHIRMVQMSQIGYIDAIETPEGDQCFFERTPVLTTNRGEIAIGDLRDGDEVITINPITLEQRSSKIKNHFIKDSKEYGKPVVKITTFNGREVICTNDHPFLTQNGWVLAKDLNQEEHFLVVYPGVKPLPHVISERKVILNVEILQQRLTAAGIKPSLIKRHTANLIDKNYLPLYNDDPRLPHLARISGFCLADGTLSKRYNEIPYTSYCFGTEYDGKLFNQDLEVLGFKLNNLGYQVSTVIDKYGREAVHHVWVTAHVNSFASLLFGLDLTYGKRVINNSKPVPDWVLNGSPLVKREFVAGFQGGDGCRIIWTKRHNKVTAGKFHIGATSQQRHPDNVASMMPFMNQLRDLVAELGVNVSEVRTETAPDALDRTVIFYKISDAETNLIKYMEMIGHRYATTKSTKSYHITEYLRYKHEIIAEREAFKAKVFELDKQKMRPCEIAKKLGVKTRAVSSVLDYALERLRAGKTEEDSETLPPRGTWGMEKWRQHSFANNNCVFMPIRSIVDAPPCLVADFTTENDDHSFIGGNVLTHNCGLVKHKAVGCYISIDRDDAMLIERVLQSGKLLTGPTEDSTTVLIINGKFMGWCPGEEMHDYLKSLKLSSQLGKDTCIVLNTRTDVLNVYTDGARPTRPLLVVDKDGELVLRKTVWKNGKWEEGKNPPEIDELLAGGAIEYLDAWEQAESEQSVVLIAQSIADLNARRREIDEAKNRRDNLVVQIAVMQGKTLSDVYTAEDREFYRKQYTQADPDAPQPPGGMDEGSMGEEGEIGEMESEEIRELYESTLRALEEDLSLTDATIQNLTVRGKRYTHCELDPNSLLGIAASIIPLPDHNQGPRNVYQCEHHLDKVRLANGDLKEIGQMKDGDEVLTVNPETGEVTTSKIKNYFKISASEHGKKIYEITTASGRKVRVTGDHPLLTSSGFKRTENLEVNKDQLVIYNAQK